MTQEEFRRLALALPGATEGSYSGPVTFRVRGRIFATLGYPDAAWGIVRLSLPEQEKLIAAKPDVFRRVPDEWHRTGSTNVKLASVDSATLQTALRLAWQRMAPKKLLDLHGHESLPAAEPAP